MCMCLCAYPYERSRDRWPSPALAEVNGSFAIHFRRRKLRKLALAQCLFYLGLEKKNAYLYWRRKWAGLLGNLPWREHAAICLVPPCWNRLGDVSGCEADNSNTWSLAFLSPEESKGTWLPIEPLLIVLMLEALKWLRPLKSLFWGKGWKVSALQSSLRVAQHFHFSILTNHFTHCHFFLPAHVIEKRHMETSMQTLQTFQHSFKTNANQFFETSFFSPPSVNSRASSQEPKVVFKNSQRNNSL